MPFFFPQGFDANNTQSWPSTAAVDGSRTQPNSGASAGAGLGLTPVRLTPQQFAARPPIDVPIPEALKPLVPSGLRHRRHLGMAVDRDFRCCCYATGRNRQPRGRSGPYSRPIDGAGNSGTVADRYPLPPALRPLVPLFFP
jgi:hypothetical protein